MRFIFINKAVKPSRIRSKVKNANQAKRLDALTRRMQRAVEIDLLRGLKTFKKRVSHEKLQEAWESGSYDSIDRVIPWEKLDEDLSKGKGTLSKSMMEALSLSLSLAGKGIPQAKELRIDAQNPALRNYVNESVNGLRDGITHDSRTQIREMVTRSFQRALSPREVADEIKNSIGLGDRYTKALRNFERGLYEKHPEPSLMEWRITRVNDYADRLLEARAKTIARTEMRRAANHAQRTAWREAANQGFIDKNKAKRVWITDGGPCELCEPMDGQETTLDESYFLEDGTPAEPGDVHPNCECIEILETG